MPEPSNVVMRRLGSADGAKRKSCSTEISSRLDKASAGLPTDSLMQSRTDTGAPTWRKRRKGLAPWLMLAPMLVHMAVVWVYPLAMNVWISFHDWQFLGESEFVGGQNYEQLIGSDEFWGGIRNSLFYTAFLPLTLIPALIIAFLVNDIRIGRGFFRSSYYATSVISLFGLALVFRFLFSDQVGLVNGYLVEAGFDRVAWLTDPTFLRIVIGALTVYKGIGWNMLVYLGALQSVDKSLIEAAKIDGAGWWRTRYSIVLPQIRPAIVFTSVLAFSALFQLFAPIVLVGGRNSFTDVPRGIRTPTVEAYIQAFALRNPGYGAAIMVVMTVLVVSISAIGVSRSEKTQ